MSLRSVWVPYFKFIIFDWLLPTTSCRKVPWPLGTKSQVSASPVGATATKWKKRKPFLRVQKASFRVRLHLCSYPQVQGWPLRILRGLTDLSEMMNELASIWNSSTSVWFYSGSFMDRLAFRLAVSDGFADAEARPSKLWKQCLES